MNEEILIKEIRLSKDDKPIVVCKILAQIIR